LSWVLAFCGFAALIILHELGHFIAAKATGMRVEKFSLFFGPMLFKVQRGETTYGVAPIPLGGYVKITGMNPAEDIPPEVAHRAYYRQPVWKRIVVIAAGPAMNILVAFLLIWMLYAFIGVPNPDPQKARVVDRIEKGYPAATTLKAGDVVLSVDGVRNTERFADLVAAHRCAGTPTKGCQATTAATVVVRRDGRDQTLRIRPIYDPGATPEPRNRLGFAYTFPNSYDPPSITFGVGTAAVDGLDRMWFVTHTTVTSIVKIFYNKQARENVSGIVGSYEVTRQSIEFDTAQAIWVLALISLSLAVVNLFPFLPLDGGHIFWAVAEKVRGRAIPFAVMERAGFIGFALVMVLFVIGLSNDIGRLAGDGFQVR
jgi:regulator of sigma E protease